MNNLNVLQSINPHGSRPRPVNPGSQGPRNVTSHLPCSGPLRLLNEQSAALTDGNADCRVAWLEVIIHLECSNRPDDHTPGGQLQKQPFFFELQNKNLDDQPAAPCCPMNCNGLNNYEYKTVCPEAWQPILETSREKKFLLHSPSLLIKMRTVWLKVASWCSGRYTRHLLSGWQPKPLCFTVWCSRMGGWFPLLCSITERFIRAGCLLFVCG